MKARGKMTLEFEVAEGTFERWSATALKENLGLSGNMVPRWMLHDLKAALPGGGSRHQLGVPWPTRLPFLVWYWFRRLRPATPSLRYSTSACRCGARMAYDERGVSGAPLHGYWECSRLLLGEGGRPADHAWRDEHTDRLPFALYELRHDREYVPPEAGDVVP